MYKHVRYMLKKPKPYKISIFSSCVYVIAIHSLIKMLFFIFFYIINLSMYIYVIYKKDEVK